MDGQSERQEGGKGLRNTKSRVVWEEVEVGRRRVVKMYNTEEESFGKKAKKGGKNLQNACCSVSVLLLTLVVVVLWSID